MATQFTNEEIVKNVSKILLAPQNKSWIERYNTYAKDIDNQMIRYEQDGECVLKSLKKFKSFFNIYSKITYASKGKDYDIRAWGENFAKITIVKKSNPECRYKVFVRGGEKSRKKKQFNIEVEDSYDSLDLFLKLFKNVKHDKDLLHSKEHLIENFMLNAFNEKKGENKLLPNIRPVTLGNAFFQLTTPVGASKHNELPHFICSSTRGSKGGGIDILARIRHEKERWRLAIIELKDENKQSESQEMVLQQALSYATFVAFLLRSDCGSLWWKIFRRNENSNERKAPVPKTLKIDVISLMPMSDSEKNKGEGNMEKLYVKIPDKEKVELHPYTLYYTVDEHGKINGFEGTLLNDIRKYHS